MLQLIEEKKTFYRQKKITVIKISKILSSPLFSFTFKKKNN